MLGSLHFLPFFYAPFEVLHPISHWPPDSLNLSPAPLTRIHLQHLLAKMAYHLLLAQVKQDVHSLVPLPLNSLTLLGLAESYCILVV